MVFPDTGSPAPPKPNAVKIVVKPSNLLVLGLVFEVATVPCHNAVSS